jgi:hypothetical protein
MELSHIGHIRMDIDGSKGFLGPEQKTCKASNVETCYDWNPRVVKIPPL